MTKINKSIRHCMKGYGPRLRNRHYSVAGYTTGVVPNDEATLHSVHCDVENGIVTDIRLYTVGAARERRDYYGESTNITSPVEEYLKCNIDWDEMIAEIENIIITEEEQ